MYDNGDAQLVLRCGQCNKPFDKQSTLKRHGYYCRSRRGGKVTRTRSCLSCAKLKARCDKRRPSCSRCTAKGLECHYPLNAPEHINSSTRQHSSDGQQRTLTTPPTAESPRAVGEIIGQEASNNSGIDLDDVPIIDADFTNLGAEDVDWQAPEIDFAAFWDQDMDIEDVDMQAIQPYPSPNTSPQSRNPVPLTDQDTQFFFPPIAITRPPTNNIRSLVQRPKLKTSTQRVANLILQNLRSYALSIKDHNALPPFIHPSLVAPGIDNPDMEPLTNCISLVRMLNNGFQGSRKLFWKNVQMECERLRDPVQKLNKWGLLAAMQALSVYILMRIDEGQTEHNNYDALMIATVISVCSQFARTDVAPPLSSTSSDYTLENTWKDWIFQESARRICVVYRVINMLIYFEPATMCDMKSDLVIAPLPGKRQLWQASDKLTWKTECERDPRYQIRYALASDGELIKLDEDPVPDAVHRHLHWDTRPITARKVVDWKEWCSGMDDLCGLVMLAASFVM